MVFEGMMMVVVMKLKEDKEERGVGGCVAELGRGIGIGG